ncbi:PREDICTED: uncharacterized protein LOC101309518 [Fragaria vesca subsp. vesca]|uniref:uncharacterized protein LOC101309518 n=1 Tax=Fragaria vesca subsp. vesca TaxID=101020 RepID=UPI0002C328F2|nr:PREDICTED: uncharacterized protein LOC101309518 [Fragaria vesca subsp. vesca]
MKQKVVIKLSVHDEKSRSKAMKTAVGVDGVDSASLPMDKDQIEVTGNDVDVVLLTTLLRKTVKHAEVVSVGAVKEEEKKKEEPKASGPIIVGWPENYAWPQNYYPVASYQCPPPNPYQCSEPSCSIM